MPNDLLPPSPAPKNRQGLPQNDPGPSTQGDAPYPTVDGTTQFTESTGLQGNSPPGDPQGGELPKTLGPYHIEGPLGVGGMGQVLAGWDPRLSRRVAIKRVRGSGARAQGRARLWREARSLAALKHPGIVTVYDIGEDESGDLYIAMELVEGWPLSKLTRLPWSPPLVVMMVEAVARALGACHHQGIVHRDIKPSNILIEAGGMPKVVDFGLARGDEENPVTETGAILGTPAYMAPEQVEGDPATPQTDVFALGILLYRLLAGVHPFKRERKRDMAMAIVAGRFTPLGDVNPELPQALIALTHRCLTLEPPHRPEDGLALADALAQINQAQGWATTQAALGEFMATLPMAPSQGSTGPTPDVRGAPIPIPLPPFPTGPRGQGSITPSPLSQGTLAPKEAPKPRHTLALGVAGVAVALTLGLGAASLLVDDGAFGPGGELLTAGGAVSSTLPSSLAQSLPQRPIIGFLGIDGPQLSEEERLLGRVLGESTLLRLSEAPDEIITAPEAVILLSGLEGDAFDPEVDLSPLTRAGRSLGHIDVGLRGRLNEAGDLRVEVVEIRQEAVLGTLTIDNALGRPIEGGIALAEALAQSLGVDLGAPSSLHRESPEAWGATLLARDAAYLGDILATRENLEWAKRLDPDFTQAHLLELAVFRGERRMEDLAAGASALLEGDRLGAMDRAYTEAWRSFGEGDAETSSRQLYALLETWPYHVEAYDLLMGQLSFIAEVKDDHETARLAKRLLRLTPHNEDPASRLIRSLHALGKLDEAPGIFEELGVPRSPQYGEVWGDLAFYNGDYAGSIPLYQGALESQETSLYAFHMIISAQILEGLCDEAAQSALDQVHRVSRTGADANLDWTYSLTAQSLTCLGRFDALGEIFEAWSAHSESGRQQVAVWGPKHLDLAGETRKTVEAAILTSLDEDSLSHAHRPEQLLNLARWGRDLDTLSAFQEEANTERLRKSTSPLGRGRFRLASQALTGRILFEKTGDVEAAIEAIGASSLLNALRAGVPSPLADQWEVERAFLAGMLLDEAGDRAGASLVFEAISEAGDERLWRTDLWYLASQYGGDHE